MVETNQDVTYSRGPSATTPVDRVPGRLLFQVDTGDLFLDDTDTIRVQIGDSRKLPTSGGIMTGPIDMNGNIINNLGNPVEVTDGVNKGYVDTLVEETSEETLTNANSYAEEYAKQYTDNYAIPLTEKGVAGGVATLGDDQKVPSEQLPPLNYDPAGSAATVQSNLDAHIADKNNPHEVLPEQIGALALTGGTMQGDIILSDIPDDPYGAVPKFYVDSHTVEDAITVEGGGAAYMSEGLGAAPYVIEFSSEDEDLSGDAGFIAESERGVPGGVATLDDSGKLSENQRPTASDIGAITQQEADERYVQQGGLTGYVTAEEVANTYLSKTEASSTYLTQSAAETTYITEAEADQRYVQAGTSEYLTEESGDQRYLKLTGGTISGSLTVTGGISANNARITNLGTPQNDSDAATKAYVDSHGGSGGGGFVAQDAAPSDTGLLWIDTSIGGVIKYYSTAESAWVAVLSIWG